MKRVELRRDDEEAGGRGWKKGISPRGAKRKKMESPVEKNESAQMLFPFVIRQKTKIYL